MARMVHRTYDCWQLIACTKNWHDGVYKRPSTLIWVSKCSCAENTFKNPIPLVRQMGEVGGSKNWCDILGNAQCVYKFLFSSSLLAWPECCDSYSAVELYLRKTSLLALISTHTLQPLFICLNEMATCLLSSQSYLHTVAPGRYKSTLLSCIWEVRH